MTTDHEDIVRGLPALLDGDRDRHGDGELDDATRRSLEQHLERCAACRRVLDELRAVVRAAGALGPLEPPRDLWPGISERLAPRPAALTPASARPGAAAVPTPLPARPGTAARHRRARRITLAVPQLVAAALVLVSLSAAAAWWAAGGAGASAGAAGGFGLSGGGAGAQAVGPAALPPAAAIPDDLARDLQALEGVLEAGREVLDPATVMILERNLATVERAIEESRRALELDPASDFLESHLTRAYERKLEYLREISRIVELAG